MTSEKQIIVLVLNDFIIGGVQRLYLELFTYLDSSKYEIHLITLIELPGKVNMYADIPDTITVHRFSFKNLFDIQAIVSLRRLIVSLQPNAVITSLFFSNTVVRIGLLFTQFPIIAVEQNTNTWKGLFQVFTDWLLSFRTNVFVASSATVREFASRQAHIPAKKFRIIHNSIDVERIRREQKEFDDHDRYRTEFGVMPGNHVAVNVARLTHQKNQPMLIEAFARFAKVHPEWKLLIVGEGPQRSALAELIKKLDAGDSVILVGARNDIFPFYFISDFFVSTSFIEGFGIAHAEALAAGLPVLTTRTAGPDEMVVEGVNGRFVEMDVSSIEEGLHAMATEGVSSDREEIRRSVERFDSRAIAGLYDTLLQEVL